MKFFKQLAAVCVAALLMVACSKQDETARAPNQLKVGTIAGPETELVEVAKNIAYEKYGLEIEIVEFEDYVLPNVALNDGSIDINIFQHQPYLDDYIAKRQQPLVAIGETFVYPMGIYSSKYQTLDALPQKAKIAIPNDASNEARALLLLQKAGLIKLVDKTGYSFTPKDVIENPKQIKFIELDAAQLPRVLTDVDAAVINTNYSIVAGLLPNRDAIVIEDADSPYANIIVVREDRMNEENIRLFVHTLHTVPVVQKAEELFKGQAIPAWKHEDDDSSLRGQ